MSEPSDSLREQFGDIDVYLFDQLLRGRIVSGCKCSMPVAAQEGISCFSCAPASMCAGLTRARRRSPPCSSHSLTFRIVELVGAQGTA